MKYHSSFKILLNSKKTVYERQFDWGGHLLKSNGGVQRQTLIIKSKSVMVYVCLTVRLTNRAEMKVGHSDPVILCGKIIAQRIKGTPGITG